MPVSTVYYFDVPETNQIFWISLFYIVLKNTIHLKELRLLNLQHPRWKIFGKEIKGKEISSGAKHIYIERSKVGIPIE